MKQTKTSQFHIRWTPERKALLEQEAQKRELTIAALINTALNEYLDIK